MTFAAGRLTHGVGVNSDLLFGSFRVGTDNDNHVTARSIEGTRLSCRSWGRT